MNHLCLAIDIFCCLHFMDSSFTQSFFISLISLPWSSPGKWNFHTLYTWSFGGYLIDKALWRHTFCSFPQEHRVSCWIQRGLTIDSLSSLLLLTPSLIHSCWRQSYMLNYGEQFVMKQQTAPNFQYCMLGQRQSSFSSKGITLKKFCLIFRVI